MLRALDATLFYALAIALVAWETARWRLGARLKRRALP